MDTPLIGSSIKESKEQELICIKNSRLALTIKGKASHPNSNIETIDKSSSVKCFLITDDFTVSVYPDDKEYREGYFFERKIQPLFFEQRNYEICIEYEKERVDDTIKFWHENVNVRNKITPTGKLNQNKFELLTGIVNFGNEIGLSSFYIQVNGQNVIRLEIEVFPAKIDYHKDYQIMLQDVTDEVYNLAFDFLKKTYQQMDLRNKYSNSDNEFFSIISVIFQKMLQAIDIIIYNIHHKLQAYKENIPSHKVRKIDSNTVKWMSKHPGKAIRNVEGRIFYKQVQTKKKEVTYDTYENRFVKYILNKTYKRLAEMKKMYIKISDRNRDKDIEIEYKLDNMCNMIHKRIEFTFLKSVSKLNDRQSMSLVFAMAPGYRELYKYYLMLQRGLSLHGELFYLSMKDTAILYEYWCFIKLNNILKCELDAEGNLKYNLVKQDILKIDSSGLTVKLKKGNPSKVVYLNPKNGEKIVLSYNPQVQSLPTVALKPDNVLSLSKRESKHKYEYIFDAKYRINIAEKGSDYARSFKTPGPEIDTINAMHRYRDAIVCGDGKDLPYERRMFGAYVLFPYNNEEEYKNHQFYDSIRTMNIGGLPFLPGSTSLVEKFLDELIMDSADSAFERATLPKGIEEKLEHVDLTNRNVLVGLLSQKEQLGICLKEKFYHIPAKEISDNSFPFEYIAIHQTKELFGDEAGIIYYGKIRWCKKVKRSDIKGLQAYKHSNGNEMYYYFDIIEWNQLDKKIIVDRMRRSYYTNIHLLQCCKTRAELSMTSMEQLRLYTELKRLSDCIVIKEKKNIAEGFEFNGSFVSVDGEYINVYTKYGKNKRYMLSYASRCMKTLFNQIRDDLECN